MGELKDTLQRDLTASMRARDALRTATLRMVLAAIGVEQVAGDQVRELSADEEQAVLNREAKKRREAAEAFRSGGANERAEREVAELAVLTDYLPQQLTDDALAALVEAAVAQARDSGASGPRAMGPVMKALGPQVAGRADGKRVAAAVRAALAA